MALETAIPVLDENNEVCGVVYGGILLNRKFDLVDRIRRSVFDVEVYDGKPLGTVTIFLWDTRIATNVMSPPKEDLRKLIRLLDAFEEMDDVKETYVNVEIPEELLREE